MPALYKNDAAIRKTEAANQWAYYQSKSNKQNLSELAVELVPEARKAFYQDEARRYKAEKAEIQTKAETLEAESIAFDEKSDSRSTSTTAGRRRRRCCRSRSRWPRSRC